MQNLETQPLLVRLGKSEGLVPTLVVLVGSKCQREGSRCLECRLGDLAVQHFVRVKKP